MGVVLCQVCEKHGSTVLDDALEDGGVVPSRINLATFSFCLPPNVGFFLFPTAPAGLALVGRPTQ